MEEYPKGVYKAHDALQVKEEMASEEVKKLRLVHSELQTQTRADREVLQQVEQINAGKPYLLQCVFGSKGCVDLT